MFSTIAPTVLTGSNQTNIIPLVASAELDIALMPDADTTIFERDLARVIGDNSAHIEVMPGVIAPYVSENRESARAVHAIDERLSIANIGFG